jgi:hypothetical protein
MSGDEEGGSFSRGSESDSEAIEPGPIQPTASSHQQRGVGEMELEGAGVLGAPAAAALRAGGEGAGGARDSVGHVRDATSVTSVSACEGLPARGGGMQVSRSGGGDGGGGRRDGERGARSGESGGGDTSEEAISSAIRAHTNTHHTTEDAIRSAMRTAMDAGIPLDDLDEL